MNSDINVSVADASCYRKYLLNSNCPAQQPIDVSIQTVNKSRAGELARDKVQFIRVASKS